MCKFLSSNGKLTVSGAFGPFLLSFVKLPKGFIVSMEDSSFSSPSLFTSTIDFMNSAGVYDYYFLISLLNT